MKKIYPLIFILLFISFIGCETETKRIEGFEVYGIDISRHQSKVNWDTIAAQGVSFAFVKATEGNGHTDKFYCDNWEAMKRVGIKRGAYHFFHPGISATDQAKNFKDMVRLDYGDLPPVLDVEIDEGVDREVLLKNIRAWLYLVKVAYGVKPIIYTSYKFYNKYIAGEFDDYPIWIARYGSKKPQLATGVNWMFWQYGNRGKMRGIDGFVDFNVFKGTKEELDKVCLGASGLLGQGWLTKK
jgi:lysozyme